LRVDSELDPTSRCVDHYTSECPFSLFWVKFLRQRLQNALSAIRYRCKHNTIEVRQLYCYVTCFSIYGKSVAKPDNLSVLRFAVAAVGFDLMSRSQLAEM